MDTLKNPCSKVGYSSKAFADADIERFKSSVRQKKPAASYLCSRCGLWHLTSKQYDSVKVLALEKELSEIKEILSKTKTELNTRIVDYNKLKNARSNNSGTNELQLQNHKLVQINLKLKRDLKIANQSRNILNHILNFLRKAKKRNQSIDGFIKMITDNLKK